jgi:bacterial/archaeal transporter family-2 protein
MVGTARKGIKMQYLLAIIIGIVGGAAIGFQVPLSNITGQRLGSLSSVFLVHLSGAIISLIILWIAGGENIREWRSIILYPMVAGALGIVIISSFIFTIPRIGTTGAMGLAIAVQLIIGMVVDHYGLFEVTLRPINLPRVGGAVLLLLGAWIILRN